MEMKTSRTVIPKMYRGKWNGGYKQFHGLKLIVVEKSLLAFEGSDEGRFGCVSPTRRT